MEKFRKILLGKRMLTNNMDKILLFSIEIRFSLPIKAPHKIKENRIISCEIVVAI